MKIIHTSDWHLGHVLYDHDRQGEMQCVCDQMVALVRQEQPDAVVVSGDVFDRTQPSNAARDMYIRTLLAMKRACEGVQIVVTAGNHDSKTALQVEGRIWREIGVRVVGQPERRADGEVDWEQMIVAVGDSERVKGYVVAVPHIFDLNYPTLDSTLPREERKAAFFGHLSRMVAERNRDGVPVVLMAHLWVTGADTMGHPFDEQVGGLETTALSQLGEGVDYVALGHIHRRQRVGREPMAYYCGSPLPMGFDEGGRHGVLVVEVKRGEVPKVREVDFVNPMPLLTVPHQPSTFEAALAEVVALSDSQQGYLRLNLLRDGLRPANYMERIMAALKEKVLRYCTCVFSDEEERREDGKKVEGVSFDEFQAKSPLEVAEMHYRRVMGLDSMPDSWREMLNSIILNQEV